jgi:hypothetical protein
MVDVLAQFPASPLRVANKAAERNVNVMAVRTRLLHRRQGIAGVFANGIDGPYLQRDQGCFGSTAGTRLSNRISATRIRTNRIDHSALCQVKSAKLAVRGCHAICRKSARKDDVSTHSAAPRYQ